MEHEGLVSIAKKTFLYAKSIQINQPLPKIEFYAIPQKPTNLEYQTKWSTIEMQYIFFGSE